MLGRSSSKRHRNGPLGARARAVPSLVHPMEAHSISSLCFAPTVRALRPLHHRQPRLSCAAAMLNEAYP